MTQAVEIQTNKGRLSGPMKVYRSMIQRFNESLKEYGELEKSVIVYHHWSTIL